MAKSPPAVIPAPLIVKLFTFALKIDAGSVIAEALVSAIVAEALLASIVPLVLVGALPEIVKVFAPTVKAPDVKVNIPAILTSPPKLIPLARFRLRLLSSTLGNSVFDPLPPITIFVALPPINVPEVVVIAPFSVNVFVPIV